MNHFFILIIMLAAFLFSSCKKDSSIPAKAADIIYQKDGRSVKVSDIKPLTLDINKDGKIDFSIFVQLMANSVGDHLYCAVNPVNDNLIKSTPEDDDKFLNMGFLIAENTSKIIDNTLLSNQRWTGDEGTLVIRHTSTSDVWYDGDWKDGNPHLVGIQHVDKGKHYFGWLRIKFDKTTEVVTLIDYSYNRIENSPMPTGN